MVETTWTGGRLEELSTPACWELLAAAAVGRLVWQGSEGPTALPVNYVVDDGAIVLTTTPYGTIARECEDSPVAFEVDHVDADTCTGWSVLVRGRASFDPLFGSRGPQPAVPAWPAGRRPLRVRVRPETVTGRRLHGT